MYLHVDFLNWTRYKFLYYNFLSHDCYCHCQCHCQRSCGNHEFYDRSNPSDHSDHDHWDRNIFYLGDRDCDRCARWDRYDRWFQGFHMIAAITELLFWAIKTIAAIVRIVAIIWKPGLTLLHCHPNIIWLLEDSPSAKEVTLQPLIHFFCSNRLRSLYLLSLEEETWNSSIYSTLQYIVLHCQIKWQFLWI